MIISKHGVRWRMSVRHQILGEPGRDNALLVTVDSGQSLHRLLFDCGEGCLSEMPYGDTQEIEAVFFSHFHVDHVAGFDSLLRANWGRPDRPMRVFGPAGTIDVIHHRLQGYTWNLVEGSTGEWIVSEIDGIQIQTARFLSSEGFGVRHDEGMVDSDGAEYRGICFDVNAIELDHGIPSMAYALHEHARTNVDMEELAKMDLKPGPWMQALKDASSHDESVVRAGDADFRTGDLRERLLRETKGESIAYLTDFILSSHEEETQLVEFLDGCDTMVCENNYGNADSELATKHRHMTSAGVARLADRVQPEQLILFHLSDRYTEEEWQAQLEEVREVFPRVEFPDNWFSTDI